MNTRNFFFLLCVLFGIIFSRGFSSSKDLTEIDDNQEFTVTTRDSISCTSMTDTFVCPIEGEREKKCKPFLSWIHWFKPTPSLKELIQTSRDLFTLCATFSICPDVKFISKFKKTIIEKKETATGLTPKETSLRNCSKEEDCQHGYAKCIHKQCQCSTRLDKKCYAGTNWYCADSSDCVSTRLVCLNNKCVWSNETTEGNNLCHYKSGASVCWGPEKSRAFPGVYCAVVSKGCVFDDYVAYEREPKAERRYLQDNPKFVWKNGSTADISKAVHAGVYLSGALGVLCQTACDHKYVGKSSADYTICEYYESPYDIPRFTYTFNILVHED